MLIVLLHGTCNLIQGTSTNAHSSDISKKQYSTYSTTLFQLVVLEVEDGQASHSSDDQFNHSPWNETVIIHTWQNSSNIINQTMEV